MPQLCQCRVPLNRRTRAEAKERAISLQGEKSACVAGVGNTECVMSPGVWSPQLSVTEVKKSPRGQNVGQYLWEDGQDPPYHSGPWQDQGSKFYTKISKQHLTICIRSQRTTGVSGNFCWLPVGPWAPLHPLLVFKGLSLPTGIRWPSPKSTTPLHQSSSP